MRIRWQARASRDLERGAELLRAWYRTRSIIARLARDMLSSEVWARIRMHVVWRRRVQNGCRIAPHWLARLLGLAGSWQSAQVTSAGLQVSHNLGDRVIGFVEMRTISAECGRILGRIVIEFDDSATLTLDGITSSAARRTAAVLQSLFDAAISAYIGQRHNEILAIARTTTQALSGFRYLANAEAQELRHAVAPHLFILSARTFSGDVKRIKEILEWFRLFHDNHHQLRATVNRNFFGFEPTACADLFDTVESKPLTPMQRHAAIVNEDNTLVLAGAGSGKTSLIVAKLAHLLHRRLCDPPAILVLAFSRDARCELERRIQHRLGAPIRVSTFHALGLHIIAMCEGRKPNVSFLATDDARLRKLIQDFVEQIFLVNPAMRITMLQWFRRYFAPYRSQMEFHQAGDYYAYLRNQDIRPLKDGRSLKGDRVKSFEECQIADFLYLNGVEYEYEAPYEYPTANQLRPQYRPDFKIGKSGLYIEHFAVDRHGRTPSFINQIEYTRSTEWKRSLHTAKRTKLIETYSWQYADGILLTSLEYALREHGVSFDPLPPERMLERLRELGRVDRLSGLLASFLRHARSSQLDIETLHERAANRPDAAHLGIFLDVFESLQKEYDRVLAERGEIDFGDMIARATRYVDEGRFKSPWEILIVDEFQDISVGRAQLLKALLAQCPTNILFAVGDDWQAIYRFAGADISVMRRFAHFFGYSEEIALDRTFRFGQTLSDIASEFICRNPHQLRKTVLSDRCVMEPAVVVIGPSADNDDSLMSALSQINLRIEGRRSSVLILHRYKFNAPKKLWDLRRPYPNFGLQYMTVHRSKGLEADFVVVLDLVSDRYGFPSGVVDDPVLDVVLAEPEPYLNAEERRLFYVALTRAREAVFLTTRNTGSVFLSELRGHPGVVELAPRASTGQACPGCGSGQLMPRQEQRGPFLGCSNYPYCRCTGPIISRRGRAGKGASSPGRSPAVDVSKVRPSDPLGEGDSP